MENREGEVSQAGGVGVKKYQEISSFNNPLNTHLRGLHSLCNLDYGEAFFFFFRRVFGRRFLDERIWTAVSGQTRLLDVSF